MSVNVLAEVREHINGDLSPTQERYTFPSSGYTVTIQRVSAQLLQDYRSRLRRKHQPPAVPTQTLTIAGEEVTQENPLDPDYQAALAAYQADMQRKEFEYFIRNTLSQYDTEAVAAFRKRQLEEFDVTYDEPDWYVFIWYLAALDPADYEEFQRIALNMSRPTRENVEAKKKSSA